MRLTQKAHLILKDHLKPSDFAIDATAGNGYDTAFLAKCVGPHGKVLSIDIQELAIQKTKKLLQDLNLERQVVLVQGCHSNLPKLVENISSQKVSAVVFNLGYLPKGERSCTTLPATTLLALKSAYELLATGGILLCTTYSGHPEGEKEAPAVAQWFLEKEKQKLLRINSHLSESPTLHTPTLWEAKKLCGGDGSAL